jgi:hypothetical protein
MQVKENLFMWIQSFLYYPNPFGQTLAMKFSWLRIQSSDIFCVPVPHSNFLGSDLIKT